MTTAKKQFNILLEPTQLTMLQQIADHIGANKAHVFRMLLLNGHKHIIANQKSCADGRPCFVPHLHPVATEPKP